MSDPTTIADAIQSQRGKRTMPAAEVPRTDYHLSHQLQQDDLATLLRLPRSQHGDLRQLLRRRFPYVEFLGEREV